MKRGEKDMGDNSADDGGGREGEGKREEKVIDKT